MPLSTTRDLSYKNDEHHPSWPRVESGYIGGRTAIPATLSMPIGPTFAAANGKRQLG